MRTIVSSSLSAGGEARRKGAPSSGRISGSLLSRNVIISILGQGAPLLIAVVVIPVLIRGLGEARFGVLLLAWMIVGYLTVFDLGLSRATTKLVAEHLGGGLEERVPALIWTSLSLMLVLGLLGCIAGISISPFLVHRTFRIPIELQPQTLRAFFLLSYFVPIMIVSARSQGCARGLSAIWAHQWRECVDGDFFLP